MVILWSNYETICKYNYNKTLFFKKSSSLLKTKLKILLITFFSFS